MSQIQPFTGRAVNPDGTVTIAFQVWLQKVRQADEARDAAQDAIIEDQGDLLATIILLNELIVDAEAAIENVNTAAEAATVAAEAANMAIEQIEAGDFELEAVNIGGTRFINNGGVLEPEP